MSNFFLLFLLLFVFAVFAGVEVWFVISLVQFIISAARKKPEMKKKLGMFIAAGVTQMVIGSIVYLVALFIANSVLY